MSSPASEAQTGVRGTMKKLLTIQEAIKKSNELKRRDKKIILAGGVFDILHIGHIRFLSEAKKNGDTLFVILESDEAVRKYKGEKRPINTENDRAEILSSLEMVDYVIILPGLFKDSDYDDLISNIKPDILATTAGDLKIEHKKRQAEKIGARVIEVIGRVKDKSTSNIVELLEI